VNGLEQNFKDILDNMLEAVYVTDRDRRIVYWNRRAEDLTGFMKEEVIGRVCSENILGHVDRRGVPLCKGDCPLSETMADGKPRETMVFLHHKDGFRRPVRVRTSPLLDANGTITGGIEVFEDAMGYLALEEKLQLLESLALLDPLTRIGNRRYLEEQLEEKFKEFQISGLALGLLFFDIDHFKRVNDTWGHIVGDRVLTVIASTLKHSLRIYDVVGRWGGEEFLLLLPNLKEGALEEVSDRLRQMISASDIFLENSAEPLHVTVSGGATLARLGETPQKALERADELLYESKAAGRNCVTFG